MDIISYTKAIDSYKIAKKADRNGRVFQTNTYYEANDIVVHNGQMYICKNPHSGGMGFNESNFTPLTSDNSDVINDSANPNSTTESYSVGKINNILGNSELSTTDKTIKGAINELFQSGISAKNGVVTALTAKGVNVTTDNTWVEIQNSITNIVESLDTEITKLNVVGSVESPYIKTITLSNPIVDYKFLVQVREFTNGTEITDLICDFDNSDSVNFQDTNGKVTFDGTMHLADNNTSGAMTQTQVLGTGAEEWTYALNKDGYNSVDNIVIENDIINIQGTNAPCVVKALGDIDITGVLSLEQIILNTEESNGGKVLLAVSFDSGLTYKGYNPTTLLWEDINVDLLSDFENKGMNKAILDILTNEELEVVRQGSKKLRFAYYLSVEDINSVAKTDSISIKVEMNGIYAMANKSDYDVVMTEGSNSVDVKIYKSSTFSINYIDNA